MSDIILHNISITELKQAISEVIKVKLKEFMQINAPQERNPEEYMTRHQACNHLKICLTTLHNRTKAGNLKSYRIGRRILYKKSEVNEAVISSRRDRIPIIIKND